MISVPVATSRDGERTELVAWIDTAFNGCLVIPQKELSELKLSKRFSSEAILADGRTVELETYSCYFDWFGNTYETLVAASEGEYALLGTMLLDGHRLTIDYSTKVVSLEQRMTTTLAGAASDSYASRELFFPRRPAAGGGSTRLSFPRALYAGQP